MSKKVRRAWLLLLLFFLTFNSLMIVTLFYPGSWYRLFITSESALLDSSGPGFVSRTYWDPAGNPHRYSVFIPWNRAPDSQRGFPVLLYLNGFGKNGDDGVKQLQDGVAPVIWNFQKECPFLVVFPQCHEEEFWDGQSSASLRALKILDEVIQRYGGDSSRVCLTGLSSGGNGVWKIAAQHPSHFASIVPISSVCPVDLARKIADTDLPVWSFYVREDSPALVDSNRAMHSSLTSLGADSRFTEIDGSKMRRQNLHDAWDFAFRDQALSRWILMQQPRNRNQKPSRFENLLSSLDEAENQAGWKLVDGVLQREDSGSSAERMLLTRKISGPGFDLRLEFKPAHDSNWELVLHDSPAVSGSRGVSVNLVGIEGGFSGVRRLEDGHWLGNLNPNAVMTIRSNEWNEMRIVVDETESLLEINGWPAYSSHNGSALDASQHVSLVSDSSSGCQWRGLRSAFVGKQSTGTKLNRETK